jgi:hypothetical protein
VVDLLQAVQLLHLRQVLVLGPHGRPILF